MLYRLSIILTYLNLSLRVLLESKLVLEYICTLIYYFSGNGMVWYAMVCYGMLWHAMVWYGMVWYAMVCYGMLWYAMV